MILILYDKFKSNDVYHFTMNKTMTITVMTILIAGTIGVFSIPVYAITDCTFTTVGTTMTLDANCTTDATISVPDGFTLDGDKHTITAVDPAAGHFVGGVIENAGTVAHVKNLRITTSSLANVCDGGADRLRGILFDGASGSIINNRVSNINQGASGCQEGNAIEIRNSPFATFGCELEDGDCHPDTQTVQIIKNKITNWQKTGIVANGDVDVFIQNNKIGASATQLNLAANSIQLGFGAIGTVSHNQVEGNQWCGALTGETATAILLFISDAAKVNQNNIHGNSDTGIFIFEDAAFVENNRVYDDRKIGDCLLSEFDVGIWDFLGGNTITNNKIRGFDTPLIGFPIGDNKVIPSHP